jgi:hypothetical protein
MLARETLRRYSGGVEFSAENGQWKISKGDGYVDQIVGRIDSADIPEEYADITQTDFS